MMEEPMDERVRFYEIWIWEIETYTQEQTSKKQDAIFQKRKDLWVHGWAGLLNEITGLKKLATNADRIHGNDLWAKDWTSATRQFQDLALQRTDWA